MNLVRSNAVSRITRRYSTIVNPLAIQDIEKRWVKLPECEKCAVAEHLAEKQKGDWKKMSLAEQRAGIFELFVF